MDLNCLIKLLLEKKYIKKTSSCKIDDTLIATYYEFEYKEIFEKIQNSEYNKNIICIGKNRYSNKGFYILNIENLEYGLTYEGDDEEIFGFRADHHNLGGCHPFKLRDIINKKTNFEVLRLNTDSQVFFELRNISITKQRIKKENERRNEVLDFLSQLP